MAIKKPDPGEENTPGTPKRENGKKPRKTASPKQKKAIEVIQSKMVEKGGFSSKKKILEEAGYSESVQKTPQKVFASQSMKKAMKSAGLDLRSLKMKHRQLLNIGRVESIQSDINIPTDEFTGMVLDAIPGSTYLRTWENSMTHSKYHYFIIPDVMTQSRMLELQYKILGELAPIKHALTDKDGKDLLTPIIYIPDNNRNPIPPGQEK